MLKTGDIAPDFRLPRFGGDESVFSAERNGRHTLLVFYKYSCPTCRLTMPFVQRLHEAYGEAGYVAAVAQDGPEETAGFRGEFALSLPLFLDQAPYPVSRLYGISVVPSILLLDGNGTIQYADIGFAKNDFLDLVRKLSEVTGMPAIDLFGNSAVPEIKPG